MQKIIFVLIFCIQFSLYSCLKRKTEYIPNVSIEKLNTLPDTSFTNISVDSLIKFYGTVKLNRGIKGYFKVTNTGKKTLYFINVQTGCGCIRILNSIMAIQIPPNQTSKIEFEIPYFTDAGYFSRAITIYGNFYPYYRRLLIECNVVK